MVSVCDLFKGWFILANATILLKSLVIAVNGVHNFSLLLFSLMFHVCKNSSTILYFSFVMKKLYEMQYLY